MHERILDEKQKSVLELLDSLEIVRDFYLAGGTALALQYGHRESVDFDFFKEETFDSAAVLEALRKRAKPEIRLQEERTLLFFLEGISCSFIGYPYPLLKETIGFRQNLSLASVADIAAMKVSAISARGTKRDFVDLFYICQRDYSLTEALTFFKEKNYELYHVLRSLTYFGDAEGDDMPIMYTRTDWQEIKTYFSEGISKFMNRS